MTQCCCAALDVVDISGCSYGHPQEKKKKISS